MTKTKNKMITTISKNTEKPSKQKNKQTIENI